MPGTLPCQLLDHGTGYLAAAAALHGVTRQRTDGGTHIRRLSLARTAWWLTRRSSDDGGGPPPTPEAFVSTIDSEVSAIAPPGAIAGRQLRWPSAGRYGTAPARWS